MFCPNCGAESEDRQQFCRKCGVNLGIIGKALTLSESIARGDRGPLPKVKEVMQNLNLDNVSEEISRGLDQMNKAIVVSIGTTKEDAKKEREKAEKEAYGPWHWKNASPEARRQHHVAEGAKSLFAGVAMMIAFYYFAGSIVLNIPPEFAARIPVDLAVLIPKIWVLGLIPALKGLGELIGVAAAGRRFEPQPAEPAALGPAEPAVTGALDEPPSYELGTVTEGTTELFDEVPRRDTAESGMPSRQTER
jgi:hypothetical protein